MSDFDDMMFDSYEDIYAEDSCDTIIGTTVIAESIKAYLIEYRGKQSWFPKSVAEVNDDTVSYESWFEPNWTTPFRPNAIEGDFE